jgi:hypothetical protein
MNQLAQLTKEQIDNLFALKKSLPQGQTTYLNANDAVQKTAIDTILSLSGQNAKNFPHLLANVGRSTINANTQQANMTQQKSAGQERVIATDITPTKDTVHLVDIGRTQSGNATATIWSNSTGNTLYNSGALLLFDADTDTLLAQGLNTNVKDGFMPCATQTDTALPVSKNLSLLYMGHTTDEDGSSRTYAYTTKMAVEEGNGIQCTVTDPVIKVQGNTEIHIAVGRTTANPPPGNTDYKYIEPATENNPYLISPFTGNVSLPGIIDLSRLTASDMSTSIFVQNGNGSTVEVPRNTAYTPDSRFTSSIGVGGQPNILTWNFPYDQLGYQSTKSIVYNSTALGNEINSYFYYAFNSIPLKDGGGNPLPPAPPFFVCSLGLPEEHSINCTKIPNLYYWWHCVAKGTLITLEDGTTLPVERINETFRVKVGIGKSLAVWATVQGKHISDPDNNNNEVYKLATANGKTIIATENHMVFMSDKKCRSIRHLVVGDTILTDAGVSKVTFCQPIPATEMFYGLALGNREEQNAPDFPRHLTSYYANGILCGDQQTMRHHIKEAHHDLEFMLPRIKRELHQDYRSALANKRY